MDETLLGRNAELEAELAAANARIAELEKVVAKLIERLGHRFHGDWNYSFAPAIRKAA